MSIVRRNWREWLRVVLFIGGATFFFLNLFQWAAVCFMFGWGTFEERRLKPNQAVITAPVEPSADIRQWATTVTQMRIALLQDNSPEDADRILTDFLRSIARGETS